MLAMLLAVAAAAAPAMSAADAERAFMIDAQVGGQWAAFRKWSTPDAVLFVPQPENAHAFTSGRAEPPVPVVWWPGASYSSCDGGHAVNTGPWVRNGGKVTGYFTTVWQRHGDSWRWTYDAGNILPQSRGLDGGLKQRQGACTGTPSGAVVLGTIGAAGYRSGGGRSKDGTLVWSWTFSPAGDRQFLAQLWNGTAFETVIEDHAAADD